MTKIYYIFGLLLSIAIMYSYLEYEKKSKIDQYLQTKTSDVIEDYNVLYHEHKMIADIIYETQLNIPKIQELFFQTLDADNSKLSKVRNSLYKELKSTYTLLQKHGIKQLHFHLKNNDSFLRFHKPSKFGDNLSSARSTVKYVNQFKKPIDGFEEGKIYNGYRYVYPMFYQGTHIGSVEVSFSTLMMSTEMMKNHDILGKFLILKKVVNEKLFKNELNNYTQAQFDDYFYETSTHDTLVQYNTKNISLSVSNETRKIIHQKVNSGKSFSLYDTKSDTVMTFLKVQNPVEKKTVGMYVFRSGTNYLKNQIKNYDRLIIGTSGFLLIFFIFVYRTMNEKKRLNKLVDIRTKELDESKKKMEKYIDLVDKNVLISSTDLNGKITYVSKAFSKMSGYTNEQLIGSNHSLLKHQDMKENIYKDLWSSITQDKTWKGEFKNLKNDGSFYWIKTTIFPDYDIHGQKIGYINIQEDITDRKYIEKVSITDGLTNIYNRRHFNDIFPKIINSSKRENELLSLIIMDVDHFKQYNDTYGHVMGDEALIKVASCMKATLKRSDDFCFRLGGEEFAVVYKTKTKEQSIEYANTIKQNIQDLKLEHKGNSACEYLTVSIGLVCKYAKEIKDDDEIYSDADHLLYDAKKSGRNKVSVKTS